MKKIFLIILCCFLGVIELNAQFSAMTYNIRYNTPNDGENWWELRKDWVAEVISSTAPDILGIQEGLHSQVQFLDSALTDYSFIGVGRDDGATSGEYAAIFYRYDKLEVVDNGTFWLSETPNKPSFGWGANFRRISTWAKFKSKDSGQTFIAFNAHLDHETPLARVNGVKLILERIKEWYTLDANLPVVLMGDFNATPEDEPIEIITSELKDSRVETATKPVGPIGTFNGFDTSHPLDKRIDYIFVNQFIAVKNYTVNGESRDNRTPSDHLPVHISFLIKK